MPVTQSILNFARWTMHSVGLETTDVVGGIWWRLREKTALCVGTVVIVSPFHA